MDLNATDVMTNETILHEEMEELEELEDAKELLGTVTEKIVTTIMSETTNMTTMMSETTNVTIMSVADELKNLKENVDVFFLIVMGIIVFLMQGGFAFLEAGSVRSKNTLNILLKNMLDVFIGGIMYWLIGYPFAYGEENSFIGLSGWASYGLSGQDYALWFFQFVFAATAATIVSGAMAERCSFGAYLFYSGFLCGFVYPVVSHWAWTEIGWLNAGGYQDFAGSGVVHLTGGIAGLCGAKCLGPRLGRFDTPTSRIQGHSLPLASLGGFLLLFGFLAFNGGSQLAISNQGDADVVATAIINTVLSGSAAAVSVMLMCRFRTFSRQGFWSFMDTLNGALTGMVAACAGCNALHPWAAFVMGVIAGPVFFACSKAMVFIGVDDPLDAVAVHAGGGMWGLIATAFLKRDGIFYGGPGTTLAWNIAGILSISVWTAVLCGGMFFALNSQGWLRVSAEDERQGLDLAKHGESAYPNEAWQEAQYRDSRRNHSNEGSLPVMSPNTGNVASTSGNVASTSGSVAGSVASTSGSGASTSGSGTSILNNVAPASSTSSSTVRRSSTTVQESNELNLVHQNS